MEGSITMMSDSLLAKKPGSPTSLRKDDRNTEQLRRHETENAKTRTRAYTVVPSAAGAWPSVRQEQQGVADGLRQFRGHEVLLRLWT